MNEWIEISCKKSEKDQAVMVEYYKVFKEQETEIIQTDTKDQTNNDKAFNS